MQLGSCSGCVCVGLKTSGQAVWQIGQPATMWYGPNVRNSAFSEAGSFREGFFIPILTENATKLTVFACWPAPIFAPVLAADAR